MSYKTLKIIKTNEDSIVEYYESAKECSLYFKYGIDPQILIDEIKKIDRSL